MYEPIQVGRLYEQIVAQIERQILQGDLQDGDQLPPERDLAEQFGVSRTAVREAVKTLSQKGLVQVSPGKGTFITTDTSEALRRSLDLIIKVGQGHDAGDLVELREVFEPEIAALAAERASAKHLACLQAVVEAMDASLDDAEGFIESDLEFHRTLAQATGNPLILTLVDSIVDLLREQRLRIFQVEGGSSRGQRHHKRILAAIANRDPRAASEAMRAHLKQVRVDSEAAPTIT